MNGFTVFNLIAFFLLLILLFTPLKKFGEKLIKEKKTRKKIKIVRWVSIILLILIILISLFIDGSGGPTWRISPSIWGNFGSFIGAILLAATLLYQIRSFRRQQVETKFFEMVRYYRDNIQEMKFRNPFYYKDDKDREVDEEFVTGRRVIKTTFEQYKVAAKLANQRISGNKNLEVGKQVGFYGYKQTEWNEEKKQNNELGDFLKPEEWNHQFLVNNLAFLITFWGIPLDIDDELRSAFKTAIGEYQQDKKLKKSIAKEIAHDVKKVVAVYEWIGNKHKYSASLKMKDRPIQFCLNSGGKIKFFGGHQYHLGHYFRHLYHTVKYIDGQPRWLVSQTEKEEYIDMLRAQMSNYEQALLFIYSLSNHGVFWEYKGAKPMITDYNLIKNLPQYFIPGMNPKYFYPKVNFEWKFNETDKEQRELGLK